MNTPRDSAKPTEPSARFNLMPDMVDAVFATQHSFLEVLFSR